MKPREKNIFFPFKKASCPALFFCVMIIATLSFPVGALSQVRSSTNYQIHNDVISSGGTERSTSPNYFVGDTINDISNVAKVSPNYKIRSGYRSFVSDNTISISAPSSITLATLSVIQTSAVGSGVWTIETSGNSGYTATIYASGTPALKSASSSTAFADYGTSTRTTWSVTDAYKFGWSAFGSHVQGFGSGTSCTASANVPSTSLLWQGFNGSTAYTFATSSDPNPGGTATTICFATEQEGAFVPGGTYRAEITVTAIPN